ncbi:non-specific lipid-transfer protein 1-like [Lycium ferocissimum]|uniref:non-specific lipid-transfer protein 1-like n=1 Tax=Lycium ferocissimum TaxID=112874 RepID=UPI002815349F|nr:non-specific lipid-transfer protein 1-like [Lycium ferocissimum]
MAISRKLVKPLSLLLLYIVIAARADAAITCSTVLNGLIPCLSFVVNGGKVPPTCCRGIKSLYGVAKTTKDRQSVCSCLKIASSSVSGINFKNAAALPGKCGVKNIPFKISPKADCSKVK